MRGGRLRALPQRRAGIEVAIDSHVVAERRVRIALRQAESGTRQPQPSIAVVVLEAPVQRCSDLAEIAIEDGVDRRLLRLRQQRAVARQVGEVRLVRGRGEGPQRRDAGGRRERHAGDGDRLARQCAERRVDLGAAGRSGDVADQVVRAARPGLDDVALAVEQRIAVLVVEREVEAAVLVDPQQRRIGGRIVAAAIGRGFPRKLASDGAEALAQDDIHDPAIGAVAVFQRDLLRQDVDAGDRLDRDVADFRQARYAVPVEQHHWRVAAAPTATGRLRGEFVEQLGERADAVGANLGGAELLVRRNVADDRTTLALPGDDDVGVGVGRFGALRAAATCGWRVRAGRRLCCKRGRQQAQGKARGRAHALPG